MYAKIDDGFGFFQAAFLFYMRDCLIGRGGVRHFKDHGHIAQTAGLPATGSIAPRARRANARCAPIVLAGTAITVRSWAIAISRLPLPARFGGRQLTDSVEVSESTPHEEPVDPRGQRQ